MENKYAYDAATKVASIKIGEVEHKFTFDTLEDVETLWTASKGNVTKFIAFASISNKLDKVAKVTESSQALAAWETACATDPAVKAKYAQATREISTALAGTQTKYAIEGVKPVVGQAADGTFRFTAKSSAKFDAMIAEFDAVRVKNEGEGWVGSFDCPTLYAQVGKAIALQIDADTLVDAKKPKELGARMFHFDSASGKMVEKGAKGNGAGGSVAGRAVANGYHSVTVSANGVKTIGKSQKDAEAMCKELGITPKSKDPSGKPYYAAALVPFVKSGAVVREFKS